MLQNADIVKGSALMLFMNKAGATGSASPVGFATEHSMEINVETVEISSKDHGDFSATLPQRITWTASASNLYSEAGVEAYYTAQAKMTPVHLVFAKASNYADYGDQAEKGIVANANGELPVSGKDAWTYGSSDVIAEGDALITSVSINASAGDNATLQISFQGVGSLTSQYDPAS